MKRPAHRPTKLTPGLQAAICEAIVQTGCSDTAACAINDISGDTLNYWRNKAKAGEQPYAGFCQAVMDARARAEENLLKKMQERGEAQQDWREIAWRLERGWKEHWGKTERHEVTGPDGEPFKVYLQWDPSEDV